MHGAIIDDIVGPCFEFNNIKTRDFHPDCRLNNGMETTPHVMRKAVSCGPILRSFAEQFLKSVNGEDKKAAALDLNMLLGMLAGASVAVPFSIGDDDDYRHAIESKAGSSPENPLRLKPVTIESQGRRWILAYSDEEWMQKTETFKLPHRIMPFVECIGIAEKLQGRSNCEPIGIALDMYTESACALTPEMLSLCKQRQ